ncbi:MAG: DNA polymerase III subunit alpha [Prolixibacteraceae bacterium]|mgnify:CR=1 FL=1|jgi:DNA-directed DNA polymerase III PolC|nr:DNA polymerase III subunit alpha [Prolixibacteraceae bacterium]MBT7000933.1 DNA polymerase III subunit alpha [Prolixibacteraceae bacterium]MBT7397322.1 DNA polymerase III subunit alpha [Prolixibacteraceae bacterium]
MLINCHSWFSLKYGAISPEKLLEELSAKGFSSCAFTDINNTSASIDFVRLAEKFNVKPVLGVDFRNGIIQKYIGLARNNEGFKALNEHLTKHLQEKLKFDDLAPGLKNTFIIYPFKSKKYSDLKENEFVGIKAAELIKLPFSEWRFRLEKLVVLQPVSFRNKRDYNVHRLLRAIENNILLSRLPLSEQASPDEMVVSKTELAGAFKNYPEIIQNTKNILSNCSIEFEFGTNKNKQFFTQSHQDDYKLLRTECKKGLKYRFGKPGKNVVERMEKELKMIDELGFSSYFLINWDIVKYARSKDYPYVGRGSGANSMVAYLLQITNVDPIELDLYFERFINPFRANPPDFDIDFSWTDRDDITNFIFSKYGWKNAALLGTYITFEHKSAFREIGKVFGLPADEITRLQKNPVPHENDQYGKWVVRYSKLISGMPSHLSIHSSGIIISEKPINYYSATHILPKGFPTTHFDMQVSADIGLYKFDILSQRGLGKIKDTLEIVRKNRNKKIDINNIKSFKDDPRVKNLLKTGKAIACFYVESPAMRMLLTKLKAEDYKRLVAASSIIRPGVAKSGMMREYIVRFQDEKRREKARKELPELYEILEETYGVMVYQEDVLKVAHYFAGLSLSEADVLRRGMSWKFRERNDFWKIKEKFFNNCRGKKYAENTISDIWNQIESFANYAFSKGHSASYAVESFQALYLKAYYPREYMVATLNNGGGFYSSELYFHEAKMHGAKIEVPCVNKSEWLNSIRGETIFIGFYILRELEHDVAENILTDRKYNSKFTGLTEFIKRVKISLDQLIILIRAGAFRFTGKSKKELLWDAHYLLGHSKKSAPEKTLFNTKTREFKLPELWKHELEDSFDEMELLGFPTRSPFQLLESAVPSKLNASQLPGLVGKNVEIVGYLVHRKPTRTSKGQIMYFGTWLDLEGRWIDTVHFPNFKNKNPFSGPGCYFITGKVVDEYGFISIETKWMKRLKYRSLDDLN